MGLNSNLLLLGILYFICFFLNSYPWRINSMITKIMFPKYILHHTLFNNTEIRLSGILLYGTRIPHDAFHRDERYHLLPSEDTSWWSKTIWSHSRILGGALIEHVGILCSQPSIVMRDWYIKMLNMGVALWERII